MRSPFLAQKDFVARFAFFQILPRSSCWPMLNGAPEESRRLTAGALGR